MRLIFPILLLLPVFAFAAELAPAGWGVVTATEANVYDKTGKQVATLNGGELFSVYKEVSVNKAPAYYVALDRPKKPKCIVPGTDCRVFLGPIPGAEDIDAYVEMSARQSLLRDYYSTLALRDQLIVRARERHLAASPAGKLAGLKTELAAVPAKDRAYEEAQRKATTNGQRLRYQDLRKELRYRTTGLQQEIRRLEETAEQWELAHPFDDSAIRQGAVWKRLSQRIGELEPKVRALDAVATDSATP